MIIIVLGWFLVGALLAVPACDVTTTMSDLDVVCIIGAVWFGMALLVYVLETE